MLRKQILKGLPAAAVPVPDGIDIAAVATVLVTSEAPDHPVDHAFDGRRGPGGSRWIAGETGEQELILAFDAPQTIRQVGLEIEELLLESLPRDRVDGTEGLVHEEDGGISSQRPGHPHPLALAA